MVAETVKKRVVEELNFEVACVTYVSPNAPALSTTLLVGDEKVVLKFVNKQLTLEVERDAAIIAEFDRLIAKKPAMSQLIQKVDIAAAEALARAHQQMVLDQNKGVTGPMTTGDNLALKAKLAQDRDRMASAGVDPDKVGDMIKEVVDEHGTAVEKTDVIHRDTGEGFIADPAQPVEGASGGDAVGVDTGAAASPESEDVKGAFSILGKKD